MRKSRQMKKKIQKKNVTSKQGTLFDKTTGLTSPKQRAKDTVEVCNLRTMKKKKNKDEVCESTKLPERNLRARTDKNYSEMSKAADFKKEERQSNKKSPTIDSSKKGIPIYRTIELFEEKVENKDDVYDFIDDLPESDQKVKKTKKSIRKPYVRRTRKLQTKNVFKTGQLKQEKKQSVTKPKQNRIFTQHNVNANIKIPEHLQNAGDSTIAEASTIVITSDQRLQQSDTNSLKNIITLQSNTQDSNMSNHPLIQQSLSPITKEVDNLFIGSPKRSTDNFCRVQDIVQSTPQMNRLLVDREKLTSVQIHFNKESIYSEDTVHLSSIINNKLTEQKSANETTQEKEENVLPRKFGTIISNFNSEECVNTVDVRQILKFREIVKKNIENKYNFVQNNFRFQNLKQFSTQEDSIKFKSCAKNSQKENRNSSPVAGPSNYFKSKITTALRQSNLNNFFNLDELPRRTRISTVHGIFDDIYCTSINRKKSQIVFEESNIENNFGFGSSILHKRSSPNKKKSVPFIATARDVARSVKGKLFIKARVKSALSRKIPENLVKKTLLNSILKNRTSQLQALANEEITEESNVENEKCKDFNDAENEISKSPMDAESEKNENLRDSEHDLNNNFTDVEDMISNDLVNAEFEKNNSFTDAEDNVNNGLINAEFEKNNSFTDSENEINKSLVDNKSKKNESLVLAELENNIFTDVEDEINNGLANAEFEKNNSFTDAENEIGKSLVDDEREKNESLVHAEIETNTTGVEDETNNSLINAELEMNNNSSDDEYETNESLMDAEYENNSFINTGNLKNKKLEATGNSITPLDPKKAFLEAASFSDTFDFLSENGEDPSLKLPDEIPMFVDTEPLHFSQPPRRSYHKKHKPVFFNTSRAIYSDNEISEEDDYDYTPKKKKKRESRLSKENKKRMEQWIKSTNETFNEIELFNLTVE